ncbi:hypothetical protein H0H92_012474 [Tricholoma furcatifolium]|nr:hypothetical protein H0H92_012474 [Tricholoma furcatifolium]
MYLPITTKLTDERVTHGIYKNLAEQIVNMGSASIANATYSTDFVSKVEDWSKNVVYRDAKDMNAEFRCNIFGQVAIEERGTIIAAKGNYYAGKTGDKFVPILDDHRIKDVIVLETPTFADSTLETLFLNQVAGLNDILAKDEIEDRCNGLNLDTREWVRNSYNDKQNPANMVVVHMLRKYDNPNKGIKRLEKKSLPSVVLDSPVDKEDAVPNVATSAEPVVQKGGFYDPHLNADFRGPFFNLINNKLVQLDIMDGDNKLIAPWKFYDALKPGTLILANCSLHCFIMRNNNNKGDVRKIYQINAHSIRILDASDGPPIPRVVPLVPESTTKISPPVIVNKSATVRRHKV